MKRHLFPLFLIFGITICSCSQNTSTNSSQHSNISTSSEKTKTESSEEYSVDYAELTNTITTQTIRSLITVDALSYNTDIYGYKTSYIEYTGSGLIFHKTNNGYYAVTNNHVTVKRNGYSKARYTVYDYLGNELNAILVEGSPEYDLSVIYIYAGTAELNTINLFRTTDLDVGEPVISLGQPKGQTNSITFGKVLGYQKGQKLNNTEEYISNVTSNVMVHDAKVASGSSGGPVLDTQLRVAGINYAGGSEDENGFSTICGAIPGYSVLEYINAVSKRLAEKNS